MEDIRELSGEEPEELLQVPSIYRGLRLILLEKRPDEWSLEKLGEEDLVEDGEQGKEVSQAGLEEVWFDLWEEELDEKPRIPDNFSGFFREYTRSYLENVPDSTLYRMLKADFLHGLIICSFRDELPSTLEELKRQLEEGVSENHYPAHHVLRGMDGA